MPRKGGVVKRQSVPDLKYNDVLVSRFINGLMDKGKKSTAQRILYNAMEILGQKANDEPLKLFHQAVDNVKPLIEVKSRRVGGATYQVPVEVRADRRVSLAIRWLIGYAKARAEKSMEASWPPNFWTPPTTAAPLSRKGKIRIRWRKPTKPSPIIVGKQFWQDRPR